MEPLQHACMEAGEFRWSLFSTLAWRQGSSDRASLVWRQGSSDRASSARLHGGRGVQIEPLQHACMEAGEFRQSLFSMEAGEFR